MRITDMDVPASHLLVRDKTKDAFKSYGSSLSDALTDLFIMRGPPAFIRSDNGSEFIA